MCWQETLVHGRAFSGRLGCCLRQELHLLHMLGGETSPVSAGSFPWLFWVFYSRASMHSAGLTVVGCRKLAG